MPAASDSEQGELVATPRREAVTDFFDDEWDDLFTQTLGTERGELADIDRRVAGETPRRG